LQNRAKDRGRGIERNHTEGEIREGTNLLVIIWRSWHPSGSMEEDFHMIIGIVWEHPSVTQTLGIQSKSIDKGVKGAEKGAFWSWEEEEGGKGEEKEPSVESAMCGEVDVFSERREK
jgi:hypothetical protein